MSVFASCQKEAVGHMPQESVTVDYSVAIYDYEIKSLGDASDVNHIWYAVYNAADGSLFYECDTPSELVGGKADCPVTMTIGKSYKVVFLALYYDEDMTPSYDIDAENAVVRQTECPFANSDKGDLFYVSKDVTAYGGMVADGVVLDRITSQINFICKHEDWTSALQRPSSSSLELRGVPVAFSLWEGSAVGQLGNVVYPRTDLPSGVDLAMDGGYVVFSAYSFAEDAPQVIEASAVLRMWDAGNDESENYLINVKTIKIQTNKQSNVQGDILSQARK